MIDRYLELQKKYWKDALLDYYIDWILRGVNSLTKKEIIKEEKGIKKFIEKYWYTEKEFCIALKRCSKEHRKLFNEKRKFDMTIPILDNHDYKKVLWWATIKLEKKDIIRLCSNEWWLLPWYKVVEQNWIQIWDVELLELSIC